MEPAKSPRNFKSIVIVSIFSIIILLFTFITLFKSSQTANGAKIKPTLIIITAVPKEQTAQSQNPFPTQVANPFPTDIPGYQNPFDSTTSNGDYQNPFQ